jgi:hypothetical protein
VRVEPASLAENGAPAERVDLAAADGGELVPELAVAALGLAEDVADLGIRELAGADFLREPVEQDAPALSRELGPAMRTELAPPPGSTQESVGGTSTLVAKLGSIEKDEC